MTIRPRMASHAAKLVLDEEDAEALMETLSREALELVHAAMGSKDEEPTRPILDAGVSDLPGGVKAVLLVIGPEHV